MDDSLWRDLLLRRLLKETIRRQTRHFFLLELRIWLDEKEKLNFKCPETSLKQTEVDMYNNVLRLFKLFTQLVLLSTN